MLDIIAMVAAAALNPAGSDGDPRHRVAIDHAGGTLSAVYETQTVLHTRQVGLRAPNRPGKARCRWTADVSVARHLEQPDGSEAPGTRRMLAPTRQIEGSFAGRCTGREDLAEQMLAGHDARLAAHVLAVAEQDRAILLAEFEAARRQERTAG